MRSQRTDENAQDGLGRRLTVAGAWTLAGRIALGAAGFVINILLARLMAPEEFGLYFLAISVVSVLILAGQLGLQVSVVRFAAQALSGATRDDPTDLSLKFALLGTGGALAVAVLYWAGGHALVGRLLSAPTLADHVLIMVLWAVVAAPLGILAEAFRGTQQYRPATLFGGLSSALMLLFCVAPLFATQRPIGLGLLLSLCAGASTASLLMALFHALAGRSAVRFAVAMPTAGILKVSLPLMLMSLATLVTTQADLWVAGAFLNKADVAAYGVAARLVQLVLMPLLVLNAVLGPLVAQMHAQGAGAKLERVLGATAAVGTLPGLVMLGVFLLAAEPVLRLLYGDAYAGAALCLVLLSAGQLINACCGPAATVLMMCGRERAVMIVSLGTAALCVVGGIILAPHLGMEGIAAAAGCASATHGLVCLLWVRRSLGIWTHPNFNGLKRAWFEVRAFRQRKMP